MSDVTASAAVPTSALAVDRVWDWPSIAALACVRLTTGLALLYAASILYGAMAGYALPSAMVFQIIPHSGFITRFEDYVPSVLLVLAAAGAISGWLKHRRILSSHSMRRTQIAVFRSLRRWGLFLIVAASVLILSSTWSGLLLGSDYHYPSIRGLIPHSDASIYFLAPMEQALTGAWSELASHRPLAAAFRQLTMAAASQSYVWTLLIQAVLVSGAFYAAARSIALWRGLWCAFAFSAFTYVLVRPFIGNVLTESLGLFWGLLSVMFFAEAIRAAKGPSQSGALGFALLSLATLTLGEMTRMGSMFTIPAFVLWIGLSFATTMRGRLGLFLLSSGIVLLVVGVQWMLTVLYGAPSAIVGGNFAYTLCGLSVGGDWTSCGKLYAAELTRLTSERDQTQFLFMRALSVIANDPFPMLRQMLGNIGNLFHYLPGFLTFSYLQPQTIPWWPLAALLPGLCWALWYRGTGRELLFWLLIIASIIASAAIVFADDGWRVFYTTWPYVALFASLGFAAPGALPFPAQAFKTISVRNGTVLVVGLVALIILAPAAFRAFYGPPLAAAAASQAQLGPREALLAGRTLTGFAVIADDAPFPKAIPAMHVSDFRRIAEKIGIERDFGTFVDAAVRHVPFAFVTAARIDHPRNQGEQLYIAPLQILSEPSEVAWKVTLGGDIRPPIVHEIKTYQRLAQPTQ